MTASCGNRQDRNAQRLDRVSAEFSRCDQAAAVQRIRALADIGFNETEIATITRWARVDVCRVLSNRQ